MFEQGFRFLNRNELDLQLAHIFRHWDASPLERAEFVGWAWVVASACDFSIGADRQQAELDLRAERDTIHVAIADQLVKTSVLDAQLASKRMFLEWLLGRIQSVRAAA